MTEPVRPRLRIASEDFELRKATARIEIRDADSARQMRVESPNLSIRVETLGREVRGAPASMDFWEPILSLEAMPMRGARTWESATLPPGPDASLYVFEHRTVRIEHAVLETRGRHRWVDVEGTVRGGSYDTHRVSLSTSLLFEGVVVYEHDPVRARAMLVAALSPEGLVARPPEILFAGTRRWLVGARVGTKGLTRFVPALR